ncbi:hypothetical protein [Corynebacterium pseudodiphtheriticum]|nr:hypothetical protein [Corynebacterium pseudodiphtheriticum]MDK4305850.1 hypothetical protein [Corynebacterium pseudodiphtheriticum]
MPGIVDWGNPGSDELGSPADAEVLRATLAAIWVRGGTSCPRRVWAGA